MNPEQQIRAAAAQATATLMNTVPPPPDDFLAMTEVVETYIRDGKMAALALCQNAAVEQVQSTPAPAPAVIAVAPVAAVPDPEPEPPAEPEAEQKDADVIPITAGAAVPPKQEHARRFIERQRKERVDSLIGQAKVAKAKAHKQRLLDEAEENALLDYAIAIDGEATTVGAYLSSLLGS